MKVKQLCILMQTDAGQTCAISTRSQDPELILSLLAPLIADPETGAVQAVPLNGEFVWESINEHRKR